EVAGSNPVTPIFSGAPIFDEISNRCLVHDFRSGDGAGAGAAFAGGDVDARPESERAAGAEHSRNPDDGGTFAARSKHRADTEEESAFYPGTGYGFPTLLVRRGRGRTAVASRMAQASESREPGGGCDCGEKSDRR